MNKPDDKLDMMAPRGVDEEAKIKIITIICSLFLSPLTFQLTRFKVDTFQSALLACVLTLTLTSILVYIVVLNIIRHRDQSLLAYEKPPLRTIFNVFSLQSNDTSILKEKTTTTNNRKKIDPKYFKPKYIFNELMSIWGTTYTVITWGSFWVIGGTLVATEKLATKIKTKYSREQQHNSSGGCTGRNDYSFFSADTSTENATPESRGKAPLRRLSSWTKRSYSSAKKKFHKFIGTGLPQLTASMVATRSPSDSNGQPHRD